jgi:hypothetical protein
LHAIYFLIVTGHVCAMLRLFDLTPETDLGSSAVLQYEQEVRRRRLSSQCPARSARFSPELSHTDRP